MAELNEPGTQVPLARRIADAILRDLPRQAGPRLPTVRALAKRHSTSVSTVRAALALLAAQGTVEVHRGRRAVAIARSEALASVNTGADPEEGLVRWLCDEIAAGTFRTGESLPKIQYLTHRTGLSRYFVARALRRLCVRGLAHRRGNRVVVGRSGEVAVSGCPGAVIGLLAGGSRNWQGLWNGAAGQFCEVFSSEADRHGVRIEYLSLPSFGSAEGETGRDARRVGSMVGDMGRFRGFLLIGTAPGLFAVHGDAIRAAVQLKLPVVWFDRNDGGAAEVFGADTFTRCHYSEDAVCGCAVDYLADRGHRIVAYVKTDESLDESGWQAARAEALRRHAQRRGVGLAVYRFDKQDWLFPVESGIAERMGTLAASGDRRVRASIAYFAEARAALMTGHGPWCPSRVSGSPLSGFYAYSAAAAQNAGERVPEAIRYGKVLWAHVGLGPALADPLCRCIIAPNDNLATNYHSTWLADLGLRVPDAVSLLSFDNAARGRFDRPTTIDPGYGCLGYQAFHAITGMIPTNRNRRGDIAARPCVVDSGTVRAAPSDPTSEP